MNTKTITTVNSVEILTFSENKNRLLPVKPICEALGIAFESQRRKINEDELLGSVATLGVSTGADGKEYKMLCLPLEYIFGWLATINPKNVNADAKEFVTKYRKECFQVLAEHFLGPQEFLIKRDEVINRETEEYERYKLEYAETKRKMNTAKSNLDKARSMTLYEWRLNKRQLGIPFDEKPEIEDAEAEAEN